MYPSTFLPEKPVLFYAVMGAGICSVDAHREVCPRIRTKALFCNWVIALSMYLLMAQKLLVPLDDSKT